MKPRPGGSLRLRLHAQVAADLASEVPLELLKRVVERVVGAEGLRGEVEISLVVADDATLRQLNTTYRGVDSTTDVLSFPLQEKSEVAEAQHFVGPPDQVLRLGDVVLSLPRAKDQAVEYGHSLSRELAYLTAHGTLHLLGYDHSSEEERQIMRGKEEAALAGEAGTQRTRDGDAE